MHASMRLIINRRIRSEMAGQLRTVCQACTVHGEMSLLRQQELHTQGCSGVPTGRNAED
jgi:hypothetical protein